MVPRVPASELGMLAGTEDEPRYFRLPDPSSGATRLWMIVCDEGWRQSIVCAGLYEWTADWLLAVIGRQPFARGLRPGAGVDG